MPNGIIYSINCALVCMRPGMAMEFVESMLGSGREQETRGFLVHMNSDMKYFCEKNVFD